MGNWRGDRTGDQKDEERRGRGKTSSNWGSQLVCAEWRGGPDNGCKLWGLASHDVALSKASVTKAKAGQGDLPVAGRSQMTQFIAVRNAKTANGPLKRTEVVPKKEGELDIWGLERRPFITGKAHMRGNPAEGD